MEVQKYQDISVKLAPMLDALSHPARLQIILHLVKYNNCPAGSISEQLPLCKSTVSQHLARLKDVGLIIANPDGATIRYQLNNEMLAQLNADYHTLLNSINELSKTRIDCPVICKK